MKRSWLVGAVLGVHGVALGSILMMQGCGTANGPHAKTTADTAAKVETGGKEMTPLFPPPVPGATSLNQAPTQATTYIVAKGDTLSKIAQKFKLSVADIKALNKMTDSSRLKEGQKLVLPGEMSTGSPVQEKKAAPVPASSSKQESSKSSGLTSGNIYVVKSGDSLGKIAKTCGTSVEAIRRANNLKGDVVRIGQKLTISSGNGAKKEPAPLPEKVVAPRPSVMTSQPMTSAAKDKKLFTPASEAFTATQGGEVEKHTTPVAAPGAVRIHIVEDGEDLDKIAMTWAVSTAEIKKLNGLTSDTVTTGQSLKIPITEE